MIDRASVICRGRVLKVEKTDSISRQQLLVRRESYNYGDPSCGWCTEMALLYVERVIEGHLEHDTIEIPFYASHHLQVSGLSENREYILFLDQLIQDSEIYVQSDPRFGSKDWFLDEYEHFIEQYLHIEDEVSRRSWIIDLCIHPALSSEGTRNYSNRSLEPSRNDKIRLMQGLLKMDFNKDHYGHLLEVVQQFGSNDELVAKCFDRLQLIKEETVYEGIDLMRAINDINPKPEYQILIDRLYPGFTAAERLSRQQKLEIIYEFLSTKK